ncbi:MAG: cysteine-rich CWC family protein [Paludibacteraceae bacterium]|nr:cysteine-rich CWC family protein [Paludibacteraceae bacterium]
MPLGQQKHCPRCGTAFTCMHDAPALCQCAGIALSPQTRAYLRATYSDCLCAACLRAINEQIQ